MGEMPRKGRHKDQGERSGKILTLHAKCSPLYISQTTAILLYCFGFLLCSLLYVHFCLWGIAWKERWNSNQAILMIFSSRGQHS
jgi:hypothetical protein